MPQDPVDALRRGALRYVLKIEQGFETTLASPTAPSGVMLRLQADPGLDHALFRATEAELAALVGEMRANSLQERFIGIAATGANAMTRLIVAEKVGTGVRPTSVQQNVPAYLVFGMFFVVAAIASLFVQEQRDGTLARLRSIGVPDTLQILGKALPYLAVNAVQAALMLAAGVWLMPVLGGDALSLAGIHWGALVAVLLAVSLAAIGFALVLASLVRSHTQASALGPMCNILMAALGGVMVPTFVMPESMQHAAAWSPMNWGLEGLLTVLLRHGALAETWPFVMPLLVFAALMLAIAAVLFPRRIR